MKRLTVLAAALGFALGAAFMLRPTPYADQRPIPVLDHLPGAPLRIVVFGTSLTALYTWPAILGPRLTDCLARPVQIEVVARPGGGSTWAQSQLGRVIALDPDLIVMEFAINDADLFDGVWLDNSAARHQQILTGLRDGLPKAGILLMTTNPVQGLQRLKRPFLRRYYDLYSDLSADLGTGLLHLAPDWAGYDLPDGLHPSDSDATAIIVPRVADLIAQSFGRGGACPP